LGFETHVRSGKLRLCPSRNRGFRILEQHGPDRAEIAAPPTTSTFATSIAYPELKPKLDTPPKADVHGASTSPTANASFSSSLPTAT